PYDRSDHLMEERIRLGPHGEDIAVTRHRQALQTSNRRATLTRMSAEGLEVMSANEPASPFSHPSHRELPRPEPFEPGAERIGDVAGSDRRCTREPRLKTWRRSRPARTSRR